MKTYKIRNKADGAILEVTEDQLAAYGLEVPNQMAKGGMIKRADGSYSQRGLWDNIRANKGSGKKPTKEMLKQEKKIRAAEKAYGGYMQMGGITDTEMRYGGYMDMGGYMAEGGINNPGFRALPEYVQEKIKANMAVGGCMECGGKMQVGGKTKKLTPEELKWLATSIRGTESADYLTGRYPDNTIPGMDTRRLKMLQDDQKSQLQNYMQNTGMMTDILQGVTPNIPFFNPKPAGSKLEDGGKLPEAGDGKWIQKAINPAHKGYCTPMTKSTCTPRRKALAKTLKKMAKNRKADGGYALGGTYEMTDAQIKELQKAGYGLRIV